MYALTFQLSALLIGILLIGLGLGWWAAHFFQQNNRTACYQDLVRLRFAHQRLQQDFTALSTQAYQCELEKNQALEQLKQSSDFQRFEELRSQLMHSRNQLRNNLVLVRKREQQIGRLTDLVKLLRQQSKSQTTLPKQSTIPHTGNNDTIELTCLDGIDSSTVQKLHMLGILNCEQLALCSTEQLKLIQRLLNEDRILPLAKWVKLARALTQHASCEQTILNEG